MSDSKLHAFDAGGYCVHCHKHECDVDPNFPEEMVCGALTVEPEAVAMDDSFEKRARQWHRLHRAEMDGGVQSLAALLREVHNAAVEKCKGKTQGMFWGALAALRAELARKTEALEDIAGHHVGTDCDTGCIEEMVHVAKLALAEPKAGGAPLHISGERIVGVVDELGPLVRMGKPTR